MKKLNLIIFLFSIFLINLTSKASSQIITVDSLFHVVSKKNESEKGVGDDLTKNSGLNNLFQSYGVISYEQVYPTAKTPKLRKVYEVKCNCKSR